METEEADETEGQSSGQPGLQAQVIVRLVLFTVSFFTVMNAGWHFSVLK